MRSISNIKRLSSDPFSMLREVEKEMKNLMDSTQPENSKNFMTNRNVYSPSCDFVEKKGHYLLSVDLPGIPKDDIFIEVKDGQLKISGERSYKHKDGDYSEKSYGRFERVMTLPKDVSEDRVEAHHENGVLTIALAKSSKVPAKSIGISSDKSKGLWSRLLGEDSKNEAETADSINSTKH